jgi:VanZ family protein
MGTIFFLSHQSGDTLQLPSFSGADKLAHMTAYGVLALSVLWFYGEKGLENPGRSTFFTVLFCLLYGMSDEYHQSFITLRSVSIYDLLADTAGAFCISLIWSMSPALWQRMVTYQKTLLKYL